MPKMFDKKIVCKNCNEAEIGLFEGKWYNTDNENQLHFTVCKNAPHKKTGGNKSQYRANSKGLDIEAIVAELNAIKTRLDIQEQRQEGQAEVIQGLVQTTGFKKANGEPVSGTS